MKQLKGWFWNLLHFLKFWALKKKNKSQSKVCEKVFQTAGVLKCDTLSINLDDSNARVGCSKIDTYNFVTEGSVLILKESSSMLKKPKHMCVTLGRSTSHEQLTRREYAFVLVDKRDHILFSKRVNNTRDWPDNLKY
jgi:hypothetical protein